MHPINHQRGEEALHGLRAYKGTWFAKVEDDAEDMNDAIADLICDLRHLADRYPALDWFQIVERAERDYYAEDDANPDDIEAATRAEDYPDNCEICGEPLDYDKSTTTTRMTTTVRLR